MKVQIEYAEQKVKFFLHAQINCHKSMKAYYQGEYLKWVEILNNLK